MNIRLLITLVLIIAKDGVVLCQGTELDEISHSDSLISFNNNNLWIELYPKTGEYVFWNNGGRIGWFGTGYYQNQCMGRFQLISDFDLWQKTMKEKSELIEKKVYLPFLDFIDDSFEIICDNNGYLLIQTSDHGNVSKIEFDVVSHFDIPISGNDSIVTRNVLREDWAVDSIVHTLLPGIVLNVYERDDGFFEIRILHSNLQSLIKGISNLKVKKGDYVDENTSIGIETSETSYELTMHTDIAFWW